MPFVTISHSPLVGGPAEIHYRRFGAGVPLLFLHGGWGYEIYPLDRQLNAIRGFQVLIPDRAGYGRSTKPALFGADFHRRAAEETLQFLDALSIKKCAFWGHSDGAVIAARVGLAAPERCLGLILEACHYDCEKPASRAFFEAMAAAPDSFGTRVNTVLAREHGENYWRELIRNEGQAWLDIARSSNSGGRNLYEGRLSELTIPALFIYGARDPRIERGEIESVRRELPAALIAVIDSGGHSPHSENLSAEECGRLIRDALTSWAIHF